MRRYMNNWYYIGGIIFAVLALILGLFGDTVDPMRRIMIVLYMCLMLHQFEEYAVPGGFPSAWNVILFQHGTGGLPPLHFRSLLF